MASRIARAIGGFVLVIVGVAMIALPGPGLLTIIAGLALLATEFEWARRALDHVKAAGGRARKYVKRRTSSSRSHSS